MNTNGSFVCMCPDGYTQLAPNDVTCLGKFSESQWQLVVHWPYCHGQVVFPGGKRRIIILRVPKTRLDPRGNYYSMMPVQISPKKYSMHIIISCCVPL